MENEPGILWVVPGFENNFQPKSLDLSDQMLTNFYDTVHTTLPRDKFVILNVNKKFLQIAMLELTPYRINIPVSFLEDLTQIIFNDSGKQNKQQAFESRLTAKIVYYKISCTRKTYSVGQGL